MRQAILCVGVLAVAGCFAGAQEAAVTANPNASAKVKKLLAYFAALPGRDAKRVLSGQQVYWSKNYGDAFEKTVVALHEKTGSWPAMIGADYIHPVGEQDFTELNERMLEWAKTGGLITSSYHAPNPWLTARPRQTWFDEERKQNKWRQGTAWDKRFADLRDLVRPGTDANGAWMRYLDGVAESLAELQRHGVVVLWRPFHENNGGWFWWGTNTNKGAPEPFKEAWRHMYRYFTDEKKLNNLLWVYSPSSNTRGNLPHGAEYYPGDEFVDMVGADCYDDDVRLPEYAEMVALGKPFGITEFGPAKKTRGSYDYTRLIEAIRDRYPAVTFYLAWGGPWSPVRNLNAKALASDPLVVNREDLDWQ